MPSVWADEHCLVNTKSRRFHFCGIFVGWMGILFKNDFAALIRYENTLVRVFYTPAVQIVIDCGVLLLRRSDISDICEDVGWLDIP